MEALTLFTIGFTKKPVETFFTLIKDSGARRVLDIRLNNASQLSGFARRDDLSFLLKAICAIDDHHLPELAPTQEILDAYRKSKDGWPWYESEFLKLLAARQVETKIRKDLIHLSCLLCSEEAPDHCHRRLVAEYLRDQWGNVVMRHLV